MFTHRNAFKGGTAVTFPTGLEPTEGGIITISPPPEGLGCAPRAGLRGRGLCGGVDGGLGCCSDTVCMGTGKRSVTEFEMNFIQDF